MPRFLVVAHQTAESPELLAKVEELVRSDPDTEFTLLVPATPVEHLLTWSEGESTEIAQRKAEAARARLEAAGANVIATLTGDASPSQAVDDELREHPDFYSAILLCTFPAGLSRWLKLDVPHQVERRSKLPVIHVTADPRRV